MTKRRKTVTLKDLSERLGISPYTISKALSGKPGMSEETRTRIIAVAAEMGYLRRGQPVRRESPRHLAVVLPSRYISEYFYFADLIQGAGQAAQAADCLLSVVGVTEEQMQADLPEQVRTSDGAIYLPMLDPPFIERALQQGPPAVVINYPHRSWRVDSIVWDAEAGIGLCVDYLVGRGCRRIAYVGTPGVAPGYRRRWIGFLEAMREHQLSPDPAEPIVPAAWPPDEVLRSVQSLLSNLDPLPDAFLCDFETTALAVARVLSEQGRQDVALACADQLSMTSRVTASIPHIYYHRDYAGREAVKMLLHRLEHPDEPFRHVRIAVDFRMG